MHANDLPSLCKSFADPAAAQLGQQVIIALIVSAILTGISMALTPKPKLPRLRQHAGRYGNNDLITQQSTEIPLPDLFGQVAVAGNMVYQSVADKNLTVSDPTLQKTNRIVVIAAGPIQAIDDVQINGVAFSARNWFYNAGTGTVGYKVDPAQTKAEAVTGTIGSDSDRPSVSLYDGFEAMDLAVPVDIRASYEREFPVYGFNGCAYLVFRAVDSTKYTQGFNVIIRSRGRICRKFDNNGFIIGTDNVFPTGDGSTKRFKLTLLDFVEGGETVDIGGTPQTRLSATNQGPANVYHFNRTKGIIEFLNAPAAAAAITIHADFYESDYTDSPTRHLVYLLTNQVHGKGYSEDKIDWASFDAHQDHCAEQVFWANAESSGNYSRYLVDYAIDARKPVEDHLLAILDGCNSVLFISDGKIKIKARAAGSSVFSFNTSNILENSFKSWQLAPNERPNRVEFSYYPVENFNALDGVPRDDDVDQRNRTNRQNDGAISVKLEFLTVTRKQQAERMAEMALRESVGRKWMVELTSTLKVLPLEPFDIVDVTHPSRPAWAAKLFRVEWIEVDEQDRYKMTLSEYYPGAYI